MTEVSQPFILKNGVLERESSVYYATNASYQEIQPNSTLENKEMSETENNQHITEHVSPLEDKNNLYETITNTNADIQNDVSDQNSVLKTDQSTQSEEQNIENKKADQNIEDTINSEEKSTEQTEVSIEEPREEIKVEIKEDSTKSEEQGEVANEPPKEESKEEPKEESKEEPEESSTDSLENYQVTENSSDSKKFEEKHENLNPSEQSETSIVSNNENSNLVDQNQNDMLNEEKLMNEELPKRNEESITNLEKPTETFSQPISSDIPNEENGKHFVSQKNTEDINLADNSPNTESIQPILENEQKNPTEEPPQHKHQPLETFPQDISLDQNQEIKIIINSEENIELSENTENIENKDLQENLNQEETQETEIKNPEFGESNEHLLQLEENIIPEQVTDKEQEHINIETSEMGAKAKENKDTLKISETAIDNKENTNQDTNSKLTKKKNNTKKSEQKENEILQEKNVNVSEPQQLEEKKGEKEEINIKSINKPKIQKPTIPDPSDALSPHNINADTSSPQIRRYSDASELSQSKNGSTSSTKSPYHSKRELTDEERQHLEESLREFKENRRQERERKRKRLAALEKQRQKEFELEQEALRKRDEELRQKEDERKRQVKEKYEKKMQEIEERKKERDKILDTKLSPKRNVPLYKKLERQFENEYVKPEQEKITEILSKKHEIFQKPTEEFAQVNTDYLRLKKQREEERRRQRELWLNNIKENNNRSLYHGKAAEIVAEEIARSKIQELEQKKRKQELLNKQKDYAKELHDRYKPKVDKKLRQEIEERNLRKSVKLPSIKEEVQQEEPIPVKKDGPRVDTYNHRYIQSLPKEKRRKSLEPSPQEDSKKLSPEKIRKIGNDYLYEVKEYVRNHKKTNSSPGKTRDSEHLEHLKYKAFKLDSKAARKEKYLQDDSKGSKNIQQQLEASKAIVDAVKMKLELLTELEAGA